MSLDLAKTVRQIEGLTHNLKGAQDDRWQRLGRAVEAMRRAPPEEIRAKLVDSSKRPFLSAGVGEGLGNAHEPDSTPENFCVLSVDGSHIDVDRHMPVSCALINIGGCVLQYGEAPDAYLFSTPTLFSNDELYMTDPTSKVTEVSIEGGILGLKRTIDEIEALEPLLRENTPHVTYPP